MQMFSKIFGRRVTPPHTGDAGSKLPILVRRSVFEDADDKRIVSALIDEFVNPLTQKGCYLTSELPPNALRSYHTDYYMAQVANGGHGQFMHNSDMKLPLLKNIREGLAAIGLEHFVGIFRDFESFVAAHPKRAAAVAANCGTGQPDPIQAELDKRFYAQDCYETLMPANGRWLKGLPELKVVADAEFAAAMEGLIAANPQREARQAVRHEEALNAALTNPIWVAGRLLCFEASCLPMLAVGGGDPSSITSDGEMVTGWHLQTGKGRKILQTGRETTFLCDTYLEDGTLLTDELMSRVGEQLASGNYAEVSKLGKMSQRAIASIPTRDVESAIDAAKDIPVVLIAQMLVQRLGTGERLNSVFAAALHESGQWLWMVQTDRRVALFGLSGDAFLLTESSGHRLASVSILDVKMALSGRQTGRS
jgi:hypothetical protein